jgi:hypothetical protein
MANRLENLFCVRVLCSIDVLMYLATAIVLDFTGTRLIQTSKSPMPSAKVTKQD